MPPMVHIKDLHKKYYSMFGIKSENILKGIDLDVDRNSIAVILGPNGSGKTTLINVITGLIGFEGKVSIGGHDITRESQLARNECGICPQINVYFKYLTIRDHFMIFSQLKQTIRQTSDGYSSDELIHIFSQLKQTIRQTSDGYSSDELIRRLDLEENIDKEAYQLSGGTLRRLVLGLALIGPNNVLILDEATAALDPRVKRKVWDLIQESGKQKTIIITSHDFEEANLLSDKICVISRGR
ncbi:unnamed protein product, partial [Oppiella nova]